MALFAQTRRSCARRGVVAVEKAALCFPVLLGVVVFALYGERQADEQHHTQTVAEAAALAAANDLFTTYTSAGGTDGGRDEAGTAATRARKIAAANGYANDAVTVNVPPTTGTYAGQPGYVEVVVAYRQKRALSSVFGAGDTTVSTRAVARGRWTPPADGTADMLKTIPEFGLVE